jgi:hypothetical protein
MRRFPRGGVLDPTSNHRAGIAGIGVDLDDDEPKNPRHGILTGVLSPMPTIGYLAALCHPRQCALRRPMDPAATNRC